MFKKNRIISVIPARGGSRGIPNKNIRDLAGKPLIVWTIHQSMRSKYVDETIVSTDDSKIKKIAVSAGASVIDRPREISGDTATTESALLHASEQLGDYDYMLLMQCTSPLRYSHQIDEAIEQLFKEKADSLLSGYINDRFLWKEGKSLNYDYRNRPRRQDKEWEFAENGSFYLFNKEILLIDKNRLGGKISQYIMPKWMSFEIDEPFDFELVEYLMKNKLLGGQDNRFLKDKIAKIKMIIFDVDGVFTDGSVYLSSDGKEELRFSRVDGKGIELLLKKGYVIAVISSEESDIVRKRMKKLGIEEIFLGIKNKSQTYNKLKAKYGVRDWQVAYCGDDIQDIPILEKVGLGCCPANSQDEVKKICDYISTKTGANNFVRDVQNLMCITRE